MAIKTWVSIGTGLLVTIWLIILGVDYAFLWGILAFALNYVPNIGWIATDALWDAEESDFDYYNRIDYLRFNSIVGSNIPVHGTSPPSNASEFPYCPAVVTTYHPSYDEDFGADITVIVKEVVSPNAAESK